MSPKTAKLAAIISTLLAVGIIAGRSIKKGGAFDAKGIIGAAIWGGTSVVVAGFAPQLGAVLAGFLAADVLVLPGGAGQPSAADVLGALLTGSNGVAATPNAQNPAGSSVYSIPGGPVVSGQGTAPVAVPRTQPTFGSPGFNGAAVIT